MKTVKDQVYEVKGDDFKTIEMRVDDSKLAKLYGMLSNIYRNPIGSIVREYASNAHDANVEANHFKELSWNEISDVYPWVKDLSSKLSITEEEFNELKKSLSKAGKEEPIIVNVDRKKQEFIVKDYGIGLSPQRMEHVFFSYLSSTKEDTDSEIGGFGIGAKSALAYTNTFFIDTVYNGVEYKYMMTKNDKGMPVGKLILSKESNDHNGTTIRVPIAEYSDLATFNSEIEKMLLYMPNIYYSGDKGFCNINDYKIIKGKNWIYSGKYRSSYSSSPSYYDSKDSMHVVLDNIPYTIDWGEIGMKVIEVPIGLVFSTGELTPTPSRESLLYTPHTIDSLKYRINEFQEWVFDTVQQQAVPTDDLVVAWKAVMNRDSKFDIAQNEVTPYYINKELLFKNLVPNTKLHTLSLISPLDINKTATFAPLKDTTLSLTDLKTLSAESSFKSYGTISLKDNGNIRILPADNYDWAGKYSSVLDCLSHKSRFLLFKGTKLTQLQVHYYLEEVLGKKWVKERLSTGFWEDANINIFKYRKLTDAGLGKIIDPYKRLTPERYAKKIDGLKILDKHIIQLVNTIGDILPNPNYERLYKAGKCYYKPKATITVPKGMIKLKVYEQWLEATKSKSVSYSVGDIMKMTPNMIYGNNEDISKVKFLRDIMISYVNYRGNKTKSSNCLKYTSFVIANKSHFKIIKELNMDNWYTVDEAIDKYKPIIRAATSFYMRRMFENYASDGKLYNDELNILSEELHSDIQEIRDYMTSETDGFFRNVDHWKYRQLIDFLIDKCVETDSLDWNIIKKANKVNKYLSKSLPFNSYMGNVTYKSIDPSNRLVMKYVTARCLLKSGVPVKVEYHLPFAEFRLHHIVKNNLQKLHLSSAETCLWEDYHGTDAYRKLTSKVEADEGN